MKRFSCPLRNRDLCETLSREEVYKRKIVTADVKNVEKVPYNSDCHIYLSIYRRKETEKR